MKIFLLIVLLMATTEGFCRSLEGTRVNKETVLSQIPGQHHGSRLNSRLNHEAYSNTKEDDYISEENYLNLFEISNSTEINYSKYSDDYYNDNFGKSRGLLTYGKDLLDGKDSAESEELDHPVLSCLACEPPNCESEYICQNAVQCWKSRTRDSLGTIRVSRGCIEKQNRVRVLCQSSPLNRTASGSATLFKSGNPDRVQRGIVLTHCCSEPDFCNNGSFPTLPPSSSAAGPGPTVYSNENEEEGFPAFIIWIIVAVLIVFAVFVAIIVGFSLKRRKAWKQQNPVPVAGETEKQESPPLNNAIEHNPLDALKPSEYNDDQDSATVTSGSGAGLPQLAQRTLGQSIQLRTMVGRGRFGQVWRGVWNCENVAVKIISPLDHASWNRETQIYSTVLLRHKNVLGYYGSDVISRESNTELWLVTHYHAGGSLYDYLNEKTITQEQLLKFMYSAANGLAFLHSEMVVTGAGTRAGIAHRDIKSRNILVSSSGECVIADFGLAITYRRDTGELDMRGSRKAGTIRYMAPEILGNTVSMKSFDSYKRADVYALALVIWEMCRRTETTLVTDAYQPPYYELIPSDPTYEEMKKIVWEEQSRPVLMHGWDLYPVLSYCTQLMRESWHYNPSVRCSALRMKKSIASFAEVSFKGLLEAASSELP